jgi:Ca2+/Na+ antiporter
MNPSNREQLARYAVLMAVACLIAIWPLPQTMALRNLAYLVGLIAAVYLFIQADSNAVRSAFQAQWPLVLFFVWLVLHFLAFSMDRSAQLHELKGFWLRCLLASVLGMALGRSLLQSGQDGLEPKYEKQSALLRASLYGTLVIYLLRYLYEVIDTGKLLHTDFFMVPFKGKPQVSIFISILLTAVFAALPTSLTTKRDKYLSMAGMLTIACCLFTLYTANTKNGFLLTALLFVAYLVKLMRGKMNFNKAMLTLVACVAMAVAGYSHVKSNPAWRSVVPDVKAGWNIEANTYWKNWVTEPPALNELGEPVNQSAYLRTAWFRAATELIAEHPQGYGLMSYSFSYLAKQKWPDFYSSENDHMVATHSGWTDLTLAFGIPALLLVQFSWWRSFLRARNFRGYWYRYIRWTVPTIALAYLTVEVSYDIFFELLFLFLAFFAALTQAAPASEAL